jgi:hypothetical protein
MRFSLRQSSHLTALYESILLIIFAIASIFCS